MKGRAIARPWDSTRHTPTTKKGKEMNDVVAMKGRAIARPWAQAPR